MIAQSRRAARRAGVAFVAALLVGCGGAPLTPPADRTLLVSDRGGATRLYEADAAAGSVTLVGSENAGDTAYADSMPARLPDGRIVFASTRAGRPALYVADPGSAAARPLFATGGAAGAAAGGTAGGEVAGAPADSDPAPCGADRILFARAPAVGAPRDLFVARLDGSGARPLTTASADDGAPCVLPDRRTVIFISDRGGAPRLQRLDLDAADPESTVIAIAAGGGPVGGGAGALGVAPAGSFIDAAPACLDDGSILFARAATGRHAQVMALALGTTPPVLRQVTEVGVLPYGAGEPVSIGGGRFLLTAGPGKGPGGKPRYGIYRLGAGGYNLTRITRDGAGYSDWARGLELLR